MHHRSPGEVDSFDHGLRVPNPVHHPVDSPDHVREGEVDEEHPQEDEDHQRRELDPFGDGTNDQGRRDDGEHHLEHAEGALRHPARVVDVRGRADALQEGVLQTAHERPAAGGLSRREDHAVADGPPEECHEARDPEELGQDRECVLRSDQATVEEHKPRQGHEEDQGR